MFVEIQYYIKKRKIILHGKFPHQPISPVPKIYSNVHPTLATIAQRGVAGQDQMFLFSPEMQSPQDQPFNANKCPLLQPKRSASLIVPSPQGCAMKIFLSGRMKDQVRQNQSNNGSGAEGGLIFWDRFTCTVRRRLLLAS